MNKWYEPLTQSQINMAVDDCYERIRTNSLDESYMYAVINGVYMFVEYAIDGGRTPGPLVQEGMENLISLASRTIKGEACRECDEGSEYKSPNRQDEYVHEHFVDKMRELVKMGELLKVEWSLGDLAKYSLNKLCLVYDIYKPLRYLSEDPTRPSNGADNIAFEDMWCHKTEDMPDIYRGGCRCWDERTGDHFKYCEVGPY
jgi:hypothetical protein